MDDLISRQAAIDVLNKLDVSDGVGISSIACDLQEEAIHSIENLPSAQPERLTDDDFEAIRIHLNAFKEDLCNQGRWKEAEDYERLIDRFMSFASAQPDWNEMIVICDCCGHAIHVKRL